MTASPLSQEEFEEQTAPVRASYSSLSKHRECPQRWNYAVVRNLQKDAPDDVRVELEFGNWWHMLKAADSLARGRQHGSLKWVPEKLKSIDGGPTLDTAAVVPADVIHLAKEWWDRQTAYVHDAWIERVGEPLHLRLSHLFEAWCDQYADQIEDERPLAVEFKWVRRLPMPEGYDPVELVGYVDEIFKDTRRNVVITRDHKSHKRLGQQSHSADMMDSQLQFYSWGAAPTVKTWGVGPIQATAYDRARMVRPATPVLTAGGTLSKSAGTDTDLATYREWALGPDEQGVPFGEEGVFYVSGKRAGEPKFGFYREEEAVVERLSTPLARSIWFQRSTVPLNANVVRAHLQAGVESAMDMERTRKRVAQTKQAGRNLGKACDWCDFSQLCRAEMFGGVNGTYDLGDMRLRVRPAKEKR